MALAPYALFSDPDEVWEALQVYEEDRVGYALAMERWINAASALLESVLNRPLRSRLISDHREDGTGRRYIVVDKSPVQAIHSLTVYYPDFLTSDTISVSSADSEMILDPLSGRITLLPNAPTGVFYRGQRNVAMSITAGYDDYEIAVFQEACIEMIATRYHEVGRNPLEKVRTDATSSIATFSKADYALLPPWTLQTLNAYRRWDV